MILEQPPIEENNQAPTPSVQEIIPTLDRDEEEDTIPYPYPKYWDEPNADAHVHAFLHTWEANYISQQLTISKAGRSKIAEFGLSLEGPTVRWHAQYSPGSFATFTNLRDKFLRLFHQQVAQRELVGQFYTTYQEAHEIVPQFII